MKNTIAVGHMAEQAAADYFTRRGYRVLDRNYLVPRLGELDLVLLRQTKLTVVEVKARSHSEAFGGLAASITPAKLKKMRNAAWCYLKEKQFMNMDVDFLAAFIDIDSGGKVVSIRTEPIEWL
jgi:putative endonuclease